MYALLVAMGFVLVSCATKKNISQTEAEIEVNPKLLFLNYIITENISGDKTVQFISKKTVDGKARGRSNKYVTSGKIGDLKCSQLNSKSQILKSIFIKNPLNKTIEFVNDSFLLESKSLRVKKAPLSLRLQLHPDSKQIVISEVIDSLLNNKKLHTTRLNTK